MGLEGVGQGQRGDKRGGGEREGRRAPHRLHTGEGLEVMQGSRSVEETPQAIRRACLKAEEFSSSVRKGPDKVRVDRF